MSRDMSVRQSWNITADSVIFGGRNSGALCSVTVSVNSKNLMITTDEQEVSYRLSKVGIADKGASAILHGDGMKISISIQSASNKKAIEELRLALECKTSDAAFTKGKSATSASSSSKTPHPSSTMIGKVKHAIKSVSRHSDGIRQSLSSVSATTIRSTPSNVLRDSFSEGGSASTHASSISQNASSAKTMETAVSTPLMAGNVNLGQEEQATSAKNPILTAAWPVHHQITPLRDSLQTPIDPYSSAYKRLQPLSLAHCLSTSRASRVQISEAVVSSPLQTIAAPAVFKSDHLKSWFHSRIDSIDPFAESISRFQGIANIGNSCYMNAILQVRL